MARIREITFDMGATVSLGQFESARPHYGEVVTLEPGDDIGEERRKLRSRVKRVVEQEIAEAKRDYEASVTAQKTKPR